MIIDKELKRKVFEVAAVNFETSDVKAYFLDMSEFIPDYFFTVPASTSGKYHSAQQCGICGQLIHAFMMQACWDMLLELNSIREDIAPDAHTRDLIRCFPFLHDCVKCGKEGGKYTVPEHPKLAANLIHESHPKHDISPEDKQFLAGMVATHSGQWNKNRKGETILPTPRTLAEKIGHYTDMFCSRAHFLYQIPDEQRAVINEIINHVNGDVTTYVGRISADLGETVMPFGKYRGMKLNDILNITGGKDYLEWIARDMNDKPELQKAASFVLQNN